MTLFRPADLLRLAAHTLVAATLLVAGNGVTAGDKPEFTATRIKGRPAKLLHQALYAKDGRLGFLEDVNQDGDDDFVHLVQDGGSTLSFRIMSLLDATPRVDVELGKGYPAGLGMANLDDDPELEFIAAYGSRRDQLTKKALLAAASFVTSALVSFNTIPSSGMGVNVTYVGAPAGLDLRDVVALDHDGSILWHRQLREEGGSHAVFDNVRFRMLAPVTDDGQVVIVLTNNVGNRALGLSGADGSTIWTVPLEGQVPAAKWSSAGLIDDGNVLPVLFQGDYLVILDPADGSVVQAGHHGMSISALPAWTTFGEGDDEGFLVYGDGRNELQLVSLTSGATLWSHEVERVRAVLPLDGDQFVVVWRYGLQLLSADGTVVLTRDAPMKVKTTFEPVYKDIDGDGSLEFVFVSGKKVVCWNPRQDRVLWTESLASFVGGVNPVALYENFYDLNGDGWLDVPAATGGGAGRWLSGESGAVILETGAGFENPLLGDWDGNGLTELFWWNNWYEVRPVKKKKKNK